MISTAMMTAPGAAGMNGISSIGQNQFGASGLEVTTATQSNDKGGMRGIGLLAMVIAEIALKKKVADLAEDYYDINRKDYDFFRNTHQGPMAATAAEAFGPQNPTYNYDLYASVPAGIAKASIIDRQWFEARRRIPKYNVGQQYRLDYEMAIARAAGVVAGWNMAVRYELNYADDRNERAYKRKLAIAGVGIGFGAIVREGLSASVSKLATAYDGIGDTIASIGNGYAAKTGYNQGRADTRERFGHDGDRR